MTEKKNNGLNRLQMLVVIIVSVIGFTASAIGGYYGGQANTKEKFHQVDLVNLEQDKDIANCQKANDELVEALEKTNKQLDIFIRLYCAKHGIVIELE